MIMRNYLAIDGVNLAKFGVWLDGHETLGEPEPDVDTISVPGRSGDLTIDNGRYKNLNITYKCGFKSDFLLNLMALRGFILSNRGYRRLEDTFYRDHYRVGRYIGGMDVTGSQMMKQGYCSITFDCQPQKWLKSGENTLTYESGSTIFNPTEFNSKPLLVVTGFGQVVIGDYRIVIAENANNRTWIDCDTMEAWFGTSNLNDKITLPDGVFPEIVPGSVPITFSSNITSVQVTPRWWTL